MTQLDITSLSISRFSYSPMAAGPAASNAKFVDVWSAGSQVDPSVDEAEITMEEEHKSHAMAPSEGEDAKSVSDLPIAVAPAPSEDARSAIKKRDDAQVLAVSSGGGALQHSVSMGSQLAPVAQLQASIMPLASGASQIVTPAQSGIVKEEMLLKHQTDFKSDRFAPAESRSATSNQVAQVFPTATPTVVPVPTVADKSVQPINPDLELAPLDEAGFTPFSNSSALAQARSQIAHPLQSLAPHVASQIATATVQAKAGATEIALNPEELGRVRMALTMSETGVLVSIFAERPETAELMRRNIELLAREFRDLGYSDVSFTFGDQSEGSAGGEGDDQPVMNKFEHPASDPQPLSIRTTVALSGGLDLKL